MKPAGAGGSDAADGLSWQTAKATVQAGLDAASAGDEVWVRSGVYTERITMPEGVSLYGGFAGTEASRAERDPRAHETILDGSGQGVVVTADVPDVAVDGLTIQNGNSEAGGGAHVNAANVRFSNNLFQRNSARMGGGIFCSSPATLALDHNVYMGNIAADGGALSCRGGMVTATNEVIAGNGALTGGAFDVTGQVTMANSTITGNGGVAVYCYQYGHVNLSNTIVAFNAAGIYREIIEGMGDVNLSYCNVFGNQDYNYALLPDQTGQNGNISADPNLSSIYNMPHLEPGSPCVDAGGPEPPAGNATDMDGQPRVQGDRVDIGADEADGTVWPKGGRTLYVAPSGSDASDGLSWENAKKTVAAALDAASGDDQVWVAGGVYTERVTVRGGVSLYGGFAGDETRLDQRDPDVHVTVLDGNAQGTVLTAGGLTAVVDGFTIRNGSADYGGGVYATATNLTLANDLITGNNAAKSGGGVFAEHGGVQLIGGEVSGNTSASTGGGVASDFGGREVSLTRARIYGNTASDSGGGVWVSKLSIESSDISGNVAGKLGGGVYVPTFGTFALSNATLTRNRASDGGGVFADESADTTIKNTVVAFNSSGLLRRNQLGTGAAPLTVTHSDFFGNTDYDYSGSSTSGYLSVDPLFVQRPMAGADGIWGTADDETGDLHLTALSPCRDAGDDTGISPTGADLDGKPRIIGSHVDIGAYEFGVVGSAFTLPDVIATLRLAGGLDDAASETVGRLNVAGGETLDVLDAMAIARKVAGLDSNP